MEHWSFTSGEDLSMDVVQELFSRYRGKMKGIALGMGSTAISLLSAGASLVFIEKGPVETQAWLSEVLRQASIMVPRVVKAKTSMDLEVTVAVALREVGKEADRKEEDRKEKPPLDIRMQRRLGQEGGEGVPDHGPA